MSGLHLLEPGWLVLLALVPLVMWIGSRSRRPSLPFAPGMLLDGGDLPPVPTTLRVRLLSLPAVLHALAAVMLVVAMARPVVRIPEPIPREGIDILLCIDRSSSMTADDLALGRSRLAVARDAAAEFIRGRPHDRIGLLSFARYTDVVCPPTTDHDALLSLLGEVATVDPDSREDATGIGAAVARSAQALQSSAVPSRVVIVLTDGEENVALPGVTGAIAPVHAAQLCERIGVRVYAIAAGSSGEGESGSPKLDTGPVEHMAARTGGRFYEARDAGALRAVYEDIDALEKSETLRARWRYEERFHGAVLAAVALVLLGALLRVTVFRVLP
ncbi:MAG: VWA domain-containing protein [Planctomycetota bacterium]|jgi:Ca-activated chloride channel family protein